MKIDHIAFWVRDLEEMKNFYIKYFHMKSGEKYVNKQKGFSSYFLSHAEGAKIELMHGEGVGPGVNGASIGPSHIAISVGTKKEVDRLTEVFRKDGIQVIREPRKTGDGYYESVIADPDGNAVEIVA